MSNHRRAALLLSLILPVAGCATSRNLDHTVNDFGASTELKAALFADRKHDYGDIDTTIYEGRLLLTGTMVSEQGRQKLVENARKAGGLSEIIDDVVIGERTSFGQGVEDTRIDATLRARLVASNEVDSEDVKIAVSKGVVYLLGAASDEAELNAALDIARSISGVDKVVSHLLLKAR